MATKTESDHDLLIRMDEKLNGITLSFNGVKDDISALEKRVIAEEKHSERQDGAISALKWALGVSSTIVTIILSLVTWWFNRG